jgi:hypothetical protein
MNVSTVALIVWISANGIKEHQPITYYQTETECNVEMVKIMEKREPNGIAFCARVIGV